MQKVSRWSTLAVLLVVQLVSGCAEPTEGEPAANAPSAPLMSVNQLMHGILFPLGNTIFFAQSEDPAALPRDPQPSMSPNALTGLYGGWQAIENSALGLAE